MRAVVAAEEDEGAAVLAAGFERGAEAADVTVEARDAGGLAFVGFAPGFVRIGVGARDFRAHAEGAGAFVIGMGDDEGEKEEPGAVAVLLDKFDGFIGEEIITVFQAVGGVAGSGFTRGDEVVFERLPGGTAPEEIRIVIVGVGLAEKPEEEIKSLFERMAGPIGIVTEPPLADESGAVAGGFEQGGHGGFAGAEGLGHGVIASGIAPHGGVAGVLSGHEHGAGRGADGTSGIKLRETQAFRSHAVEVGGADFWLPITTQFAVSEIVGENEQDVGFFRQGGTGREHAEEAGKEEAGDAPQQDVHV